MKETLDQMRSRHLSEETKLINRAQTERRRNEKRAHERAEAAAKRAVAEETRRVRAALIGRTITEVGFDGTAEGTYVLKLDDSTVVEFSSSGDDATYTSCNIEAAK